MLSSSLLLFVEFNSFFKRRTLLLVDVQYSTFSRNEDTSFSKRFLLGRKSKGPMKGASAMQLEISHINFLNNLNIYSFKKFFEEDYG